LNARAKNECVENCESIFFWPSKGDAGSDWQSSDKAAMNHGLLVLRDKIDHILLGNAYWYVVGIQKITFRFRVG
jgi:hypothetical protein